MEVGSGVIQRKGGRGKILRVGFNVGLDVGVIEVEQQVVGVQILGDLEFGGDDLINRAKAVQVLGADGSDDGIIGRIVTDKLIDVLRAVGAKFGDKIAGVFGQTQAEGGGQAKGGVVGMGGFEGGSGRIEDLEKKVLGGGFAKRAGNGDGDQFLVLGEK